MPMLARPISSTAHPVTGSAPTTPVVLSTGVSTTPLGAVVVAVTLNCTGIVSGEFATPAATIVSVPDTDVPFGYDLGFTETRNVPLPFPDAGLTVSHVASEVTDH